MHLIPAIDIINGKCVRLTQGDYLQVKIYNEHPLEVAKEFEDIGLKRLHLVDLDGAKAGTVKNWKVLEQIAGKTAMVIDFGGGIKSLQDVDIVFNSGAALATIGSMAVKEEALFKMIIQHFGADKFLLGADVNKEKIAVAGWTQQTDIWIIDFIRNYQQSGIQQFFCTDISKDGMLEGPATELYKKLLGEIENLNLIASGGVSNMHDVHELQEIGCAGVIIGKAIYENRITVQEIKDFITKEANTKTTAVTDRIVNSIPVNELWNSTSVVKANRSRFLTRDEVKDLLKDQPVQFIIADTGKELEWIDMDECHVFWKTVVKVHLANNYSQIQLEMYPDGYSFIASEWISNNKFPIVLLEKMH